MSYRPKRVANVIKEAVANIILNDLADPNFCFVAVTQAKVSPDLKIATIYFSILGDKIQQERVFDHLNRAKGRIRQLLGKRITLRYLPELNFEIDALLLEEKKVGEILDELYPRKPTA
jgi:ribosome-binding factor A|uniref:Ribosome-binding factor A n=1 Tax=candidate division WOR-3 bacterium TaxID=2052148 RepID=A0A7C6ED15_UNCW3